MSCAAFRKRQPGNRHLMSTGKAPRKNVIGFTQPADFYYRAAQRALQADDIPNAVAGARTAVEKEPENARYILLLARLLVDVQKNEESLQLLFDLLSRDEQADAECMFLLGLNFLALGDHEKAQECFGEYLTLAPEGEHVEEIDEYLLYDGPENDPSLYYFDDVNEHEARIKSYQVKTDLENGRYRQAARILESVPPSQADKPFIRNSLALALFFSGRQEEALEETKKVLETDPGNIQGNCNMAVFLSRLGRTDEMDGYLSRLTAAEPETQKERFQIAATYCDIGDHEKAYHAMHEYNVLGFADVKSLFCEAVAAYNTHRIREAVRVLSDVRKIDRPAIIADYYLKHMNAVLSDPDSFSILPYVYRLPPEEGGRRVIYLNECLRLDQAVFQQRWLEDREFEDTLRWVMEYGDENVQIAVCVMIAGFGDRKAEKMLRGFLLSKARPDVVKNEILVLLDHIGAQGPYIVYLSGELAEVHVNAEKKDDRAVQQLDKLYEAVRLLAEQTDSAGLMQQAMHVGSAALRSEWHDEFSQDLLKTAAAALWLASDTAGHPLSLADLAEGANTAAGQIRASIDRLLLL